MFFVISVFVSIGYFNNFIFGLICVIGCGIFCVIIGYYDVIWVGIFYFVRRLFIGNRFKLMFLKINLDF